MQEMYSFTTVVCEPRAPGTALGVWDPHGQGQSDLRISDAREVRCPEPRVFQEGLRGGGRARIELGKIEERCFHQTEEHLYGAERAKAAWRAHGDTACGHAGSGNGKDWRVCRRLREPSGGGRS